MSGLRKTLGPVSLWALGVGYVISGEYFGWNLGLVEGGTYGMLAATLVVTVMYGAFVPSYAELACALPRAGGAFVYADAAFGRALGAVVGVAQLVEFVLAPPAIALAIGAYLHLSVPALSPVMLAAIAYVALTAINVWGVRQAALFEVVVTAIAVVELLVFMGATAPAFRWEAFSRDALPHGIAGAFAAIPFAIWFYLGIEGLANAAEEARDPARELGRGFGAAMITLVLLALGVFVCAVGVSGWHAVVFPEGSAEPSDSPLPLAMGLAVSRTSWLYRTLVGIGLFGLVASFHGILLAAGRATLALGQAGHLPKLLGEVHARTGTPVPALLANLAVGLLALATGRTADLIVLSCFGAITLYAASMVALFVLRRTRPMLVRPVRAPGYPLVPAVALGLALVCAVAMTVAHPWLALLFVAVCALGAAPSLLVAKGQPR